MSVIFINHVKSQCGVYEIGKRIFDLIDKKTLPVKYFETSVNGLNEYLKIIETEKPDFILYNYFSVTLPYLNKSLFKMFPNIKHIGIIHDPLTPQMIDFYNNTFDCWVIHDQTNKSISNNKFTTVRPIRRFEKLEKKPNGTLQIGSHGFSVSPWKMFDKIIDLINHEFDEVVINMNITQATFGGYEDPKRFDNWRKLITKKNVHLNITNTYYETENELINYLSKNDLNVYFYNPPHEFVGVGGSADLAVSSQSSLVVNNTYMYRHFHDYLGFFEQKNNLTSFLDNKKEVKKLYDLWSPEKMTQDYKNMIESL
jgi:hypothetical protein